jgi:hypothetical protein
MLNRIPFGLMTLEIVWVSCLVFGAMAVFRSVDLNRLCSGAAVACSAFGVR